MQTNCAAARIPRLPLGRRQPRSRPASGAFAQTSAPGPSNLMRLLRCVTSSNRSCRAAARSIRTPAPCFSRKFLRRARARCRHCPCPFPVPSFLSHQRSTQETPTPDAPRRVGTSRTRRAFTASSVGLDGPFRSPLSVTARMGLAGSVASPTTNRIMESRRRPGWGLRSVLGRRHARRLM